MNFFLNDNNLKKNWQYLRIDTVYRYVHMHYSIPIINSSKNNVQCKYMELLGQGLRALISSAFYRVQIADCNFYVQFYFATAPIRVIGPNDLRFKKKVAEYAAVPKVRQWFIRIILNNGRLYKKQKCIC